MLVFLTSTGAILHRATAKIPTGDNVADSYWRSGNVLGSLHPETGQLEPAVTGSAHNLRSVEIHPDTHARLIGTILPDWPQLVDMVLRAATLLPGIGTQSRDIAISADGPVILEVNLDGDLNLTPLPSGRGTLDAVYGQHLARHGYRLIQE